MLMKGKILIVEDEFIVASDLRMILEKAGHQICGIASSVPKALEIIQLKKPAWVFLDIQLSGKLTGIDLAWQLIEMEIPFIYVSANSNQSVLETAKATKPYGFLVKPFREKDVLVTLDIANYRHENNLGAKLIRELDLQTTIVDILDNTSDIQKKLGWILIALKNHISFDYGAICWEIPGDEMMKSFAFIDKGNGLEYVSIDSLSDLAGKTTVEIKNAKKAAVAIHRVTFFCNRTFEEMIGVNPFRKIVSRTFDLESALIVPVKIAHKGTCIFSFYSHEPDGFNQEHLVLIDRLKLLLARIADNCMAGFHGAAKLMPVPPPQVVTEKLDFKKITGEEQSISLIGSSLSFGDVKKQVGIVAPFDISVLVLGESGTGKESIAQAIHRFSSRRNSPIVKVNCAAIPATLMESELFGHEKGAFTGAVARRIGKFEQAIGGTIFLDEIGELPLDLQVKLLCVLQEKEIVRLGGSQIIKTDVRVVAATNRNLEKEVAEGRFRLDLYYRLNVFPITLPPLRDRKEDINELANYFLEKLSAKIGKEVTAIAEQAYDDLNNYDWPGNIRELENLMERSVLLTTGSTLMEVDLPGKEMPDSTTYAIEGKVKTIREMEKDYILSILKKCKGRIGGPGGAAELLDIPPTTLISKINKLGIVKKFTS